MSSIKRDSTCLGALACYNFLYGFKGTPAARQARRPGRGFEGRREPPRERNSRDDRAVSGPGRRGTRRRGAAAFPAPSGRKPYGAASCRARLPGTGPRAVPAVAPKCRTCKRCPAACLGARRLPPDEESQWRGRNAAHRTERPLHPQGHPKILSNRFAESIFGTHPCARSLCRPGGPDGEGQANGQAPKHAANLPTRHALRGGRILAAPTACFSSTRR